MLRESRIDSDFQEVFRFDFPQYHFASVTKLFLQIGEKMRVSEEKVFTLY